MANNRYRPIRITPDDQEKSFNWYKGQGKRLALGLAGTDTLSNQSLVGSVVPGNMYLFLYDPKYKETLPYYDTAHLVIPFKSVAAGFLGLNLHYLPYGSRFKLVEELSKLTADARISERTKINLSWQLIDNTARFAPAKQCVKHYLTSHMRSRFLKINFQDWKTAAMLPVQQFQKGSPY